jgi:hypothetical protein
MSGPDGEKDTPDIPESSSIDRSKGVKPKDVELSSLGKIVRF